MTLTSSMTRRQLRRPWFRDQLPRRAALVPARRHASFLGGVYRNVVEEGDAMTDF
jgi:hypothetical protein